MPSSPPFGATLWVFRANLEIQLEKFAEISFDGNQDSSAACHSIIQQKFVELELPSMPCARFPPSVQRVMWESYVGNIVGAFDSVWGKIRRGRGAFLKEMTSKLD